MTRHLAWALLGAACTPVPDDADGDGFSELDGDCDDHDPSVTTRITVYDDADGDGFGDDATGRTVSCTGGAVAGIRTGGDCDDADPDRFPVEVGEDADADGYAAGPRGPGCVRPGWGAGPEDCDDGDDEVHPGAPERCNGADDDCDDAIDEVDADGEPTDGATYWRDADGDGHGDPTEPSTRCEDEAGWAPDLADCDDGDPGAFLEVDVCGQPGGAHCGPSEGSCETPATLAAPFPAGVEGRDPRGGDAGYAGVLRPGLVLGSDDERPGAIGAADEVVMFEPDLVGWSHAVRYRLPVAAGSDNGRTHARLAHVGAATRLVVADTDPNGASDGSLWLVNVSSVRPADVVDLPTVDDVRVDMPHHGSRVGFDVEVADLLGGPDDDVLVTAPSFGYNEDALYVVPGPRVFDLLQPIRSLDDADVVKITDDRGLVVGVDAAVGRDDAQAYVALASWGAYGVEPGVWVIPANRLMDATLEGAATFSWTDPDATPAAYADDGPRVAWIELPGQRPRLVFATSHALESHVHVFVPDGSGNLPAQPTKTFVLPFSDCTEVTASGATLVVACPLQYLERGYNDFGAVFTFDSTGPAGDVDVGDSEQLVSDYTYGFLGARGISEVTQAGTSYVLLDHTVAAGRNGLSYVTRTQ